MVIAVSVVCVVSGIALILSVMLQTTKADSFSAAMGAGMETRFKPGSREEWLYKITRVSAVFWMVTCVLTSYLWYRGH